MKQKDTDHPEFSEPEIKFLQQLRAHPGLQEHFQDILNLAHPVEGPLKSADEVEELLVQKLRQLGHASISEWATQAEARVGAELKEQDPTLRSRKKKR